MKKLLLLTAALVLLSGCGKAPLTNQEIVDETKTCEEAELYAHSLTKINGQVFSIVCKEAALHKPTYVAPSTACINRGGTPRISAWTGEVKDCIHPPSNPINN